MIFFRKKVLEKLLSMKFSEESFAKFNDPNDPLYGMYKDRKCEESHDRGYNNAIEDCMRLLRNNGIK